VSLAPSGQEPAVDAAQFRHNKIERGARRSKPPRLVENSAGAGERGDCEAVPVGQLLVVAARLRMRLTQGEEFRARGGEAGFLLRRAARCYAAQHGSAFPIAIPRDVVSGLETRRRAAQRAVDLLFAPDIEQAFLAVLIGVEGGGD